MIKIGFDQYLIILNTIVILFLIICWFREIWRESTSEWNLSQQHLCHCRSCSLTFLTGRMESVVRCPSCREMIRVRAKKASKRIRY